MRLVKLLLLLVSLSVVIGQLLPSSAVSGQSGGQLSAPTGVTASDGAYSNKVGISWDVIRNATAYQVFRNTSNDAASALSLGTTAAASFFDASAGAGQSYYYWVRAENGSAASSLSAPDQGSRASGTTVALNPPPAPAGNPVTAAKAALGKVLFWDEQLSSMRTVACGTCHHAFNGGSDPRSMNGNSRSTHPGVDGVFGNADDIQGSIGVPLSLANGNYAWSAAFGIREQVTGRRGMSYVNAGYPGSLFWDGRATQVFKDPLTSAVVLANGGALESQVLGPPVNSAEMGHTGRDWNDVAARGWPRG